MVEILISDHSINIGLFLFKQQYYGYIQFHNILKLSTVNKGQKVMTACKK